MKLLQHLRRSANAGLARQLHKPVVARSFSSGTNDGGEGFPFESTDNFHQRLFGENTRTDPYQIFDRAEKAYGRIGISSRRSNRQGASDSFNNMDASMNTLSDGMDLKLMDAARNFVFDEEETSTGDYTFRPDVTFWPGNTYETQDLNIRKPGVQKPSKRKEFETTTEEVLRKADFRNVRFLANFITEAGTIIKRSQTGISAKAQRKIAREIKTARAFGLIPFTSMGTKQFRFGQTMEDLDRDFEYEAYGVPSFVETENGEPL